MIVEDTKIPDVKLIKPAVFSDHRGWFSESWNEHLFRERVSDCGFVQDNVSMSSKGILRGIHYQIDQPQGKLVRVANGAVFDVAVDLRRQSPSFGQWVAATLTGENHHQLFVPEGFGHGFLVLSAEAQFCYKCTDYYAPESERTIIWDDPDLNIDWPLEYIGEPVLSAKDRQASQFRCSETYQ